MDQTSLGEARQELLHKLSPLMFRKDELSSLMPDANSSDVEIANRKQLSLWPGPSPSLQTILSQLNGSARTALTGEIDT